MKQYLLVLPALLLSAQLLGGCGGSPMREPPEQITFDGRTAYFSDGRAEVIKEDEARTYTINSTDNTVHSAPYPARIPGHVAQSWLMVKQETDGTQLAYVVVSWDDDDPTDYLAGGWWSKFPKDERDLDLFNTESLFFFVDGPETDTRHPPTLPASGTATYLGRSGGLFQYIEAVGYARHYSLSEYEAPVRLTADFGAGLVRGCLGCDGGILAGEQHIGALLQSSTIAETPRADPTGYELHFGPVGWRENVTIYQEAVGVVHDRRTVIGTEGVFGAQFSNRPVQTGEPRLMTGAYSVTFAEADGSRGRFSGAFDAQYEKP